MSGGVLPVVSFQLDFQEPLAVKNEESADFPFAIFLSSLAQDFIEETLSSSTNFESPAFLSSLAQDFIEECCCNRYQYSDRIIPEFSSSGLH